MPDHDSSTRLREPIIELRIRMKISTAKTTRAATTIRTTVIPRVSLRLEDWAIIH